MSRPERKLRTLLKSPKIEHKWKDSVGEEIQFQGLSPRYSCWTAIGPARQLFDEELGPAIQTFLYGFVPSTALVYITLCLIGKRRETAAPKVIFSCPSSELRKKLIRNIEQSSIMAPDRFAGIGLGESPLPPGQSPRRLLAGHDEEPVIQRPLADTTFTTLVFALNPRVTPGDRLIIKGNMGNNGGNTRATAGPMIYWEDKVFCLTAAHIFDGNGHGSASDEDDPINSAACHFDGMSDDEAISDGDSEQELMSTASLTPQEEYLVGVPSYGEWERDMSPSHSSLPSTRGSKRPSLSPIETARYQYEPPHPIDKCEPLHSIGGLYLKASQSSLDYALIDVTESAVPISNSIFTLDRTLKITEIGSRDVRICTVTCSSGILLGTLFPRVTYVRLPNELGFQKLYEVELDGVIAEGDCGSGVVDRENGSFYGLIIAGTPGTRNAFLIPAVDVARDLETQHGIKISLFDVQSHKPNAGDGFGTKHPGTPELIDSVSIEQCLRSLTRSECSDDPLDTIPIFSEQSAATTVSSEYVTAKLRPFAAKLVDLMANDAVLKPIYRVAIGDEAAATDKFKQTFHHLLVMYGFGLTSEAQTYRTLVAGCIVVWQARHVATEITRRYAPMLSIRPIQPLVPYKEEPTVRDTPHFNVLPSELSDSEAKEDLSKSLALFEETKSFLTEAKAFNNLRRSMDDFVRKRSDKEPVVKIPASASPSDPSHEHSERQSQLPGGFGASLPDFNLNSRTLGYPPRDVSYNSCLPYRWPKHPDLVALWMLLDDHGARREPSSTRDYESDTHSSEPYAPTSKATSVSDNKGQDQASHDTYNEESLGISNLLQ